MKPCPYLYLATQTAKGMVKIAMALLQCGSKIIIARCMFSWEVYCL